MTATAVDLSNPESAPPPHRWRPWLWCLAAIPAIIPWYVFAHYHVDIVWNDAWDFAELLVKSHLGTLRFSDFWVAHNEHRMPIPYLIMYVLARLTRWNTYAEVYFGYAMVCQLSYLFALLLRTTADRHWIWPWFLINVLIFSPIQCENWTFGFAACQNFIPIPCIIGAMLLLYRRGLTWGALLISGLLIEIASLSLANGLLGWLMIAPLLVLLASPLGQRKWFILAWIVMVAVSLTVQFWGYHTYSWAAVYYSGDVWKRAQFFFGFLGNPLNFEHEDWPNLTIAVGVAVSLVYVLIVIWLLWIWISGDIQRVKRMLPWVLLGGYGFAGALLGAFGRAGLGMQQALTSRYTTIAMLLLICFVGVLYVPPSPATEQSRWRAIRPYLKGAFITLMLVGLAFGYARLPIQYMRRMALFRGAMSHVTFIHLISEPHGKILTGQFDDLRQRADALSEAGYLQTRLIDNNDISDLMPKGADEAALRGSNGELNGASKEEGDLIKIWGWAILRSQRRGADAVLITYEDENKVPRLCGVGNVEYLSDNVAAALGRDFFRSGWITYFPVNRLPAGVHRLICWAYDAELQVAYPLGGSSIQITSGP